MSRTIGTVAALLLALTACGGDPETPADDAPSSSAPAEGTPTHDANHVDRITEPGDGTGTIEGLVEVNGHDLYVRCTGEGSPTVVYLHGWIPDAGTDHTRTADGLESELDDFRFCSYDRRNTQRSESVPGTQRPEDVVADLTGVLEAVGEDGPFLLIGASFGGMVAHAFAVDHPQAVAGIVMLDAAVADEVLVDGLKPPAFRASSRANQRADAHESQERINNWVFYEWVYTRRHREPDVPLVYLASAQEKATVHPEFEAPEYDAQYYPRLKAFAARWSPGKLEWVDAPHFMEPVIPDRIAAAVREVAHLSQRKS